MLESRYWLHSALDRRAQGFWGPALVPKRHRLRGAEYPLRVKSRHWPPSGPSLLYPQQRTSSADAPCPLSARSRHAPYSITTSARPSSYIGTEIPRSLAVLRLIR